MKVRFRLERMEDGGIGDSRLKLAIPPPDEASYLRGLLAALASSAANLVTQGQTFILLTERGREPGLVAATAEDKETTALPVSSLEAHLKLRPGLLDQLARGEQVMLADVDRQLLPHSQAVNSSTRHLLLLPLIHESNLEALLCVSLRGPRRKLSPRQLEPLQQFCRKAGPVVAGARQLAASRQKSTELEALVQMKLRLIANFIHELRTPLVAIRGYCKMLLEGRAGPINETQKEYLANVSKNANRVVSSLEDLEWCASHEQLRLESFDLRELCSESLGKIQPPALEKSIKITEVTSPASLVVTGDRQKLAQVLDQLLSNSVAFTDRNGEIAVALSSSADEQMIIKISSSGPGLPPEVPDQLLEAGAHAGNSPPDSPDGLVQLLCWVHNIVRLHGGRFYVTRKPGEGSSFICKLPVIQAEAGAKPFDDQAADFSS